MNRMIKISLILNILVLIPVCFGIIFNSDWAIQAWGIKQPSLDILVSVYFTILLASIYLLINQNINFIFMLLTLQIIYKIFSIFFVGALYNPVVLSNFLIAIVHSFSLYLIIRSKKNLRA